MFTQLPGLSPGELQTPYLSSEDPGPKIERVKASASEVDNVIKNKKEDHPSIKWYKFEYKPDKFEVVFCRNLDPETLVAVNLVARQLGISLPTELSCDELTLLYTAQGMCPEKAKEKAQKAAPQEKPVKLESLGTGLLQEMAALTSEQQDLVVDNLALATDLAYKFSQRQNSLEFDELISIARYGLVRAAEKYDPSRGVKFSTFAYATIRNEILAEIERGRRKREMFQKLRANDSLAGKVRREYDRASVAKYDPAARYESIIDSLLDSL